MSFNLRYLSLSKTEGGQKLVFVLNKMLSRSCLNLLMTYCKLLKKQDLSHCEIKFNVTVKFNFPCYVLKTEIPMRKCLRNCYLEQQSK